MYSLLELQQMVGNVNELNGWTPTKKDLESKWFIPGKLMLIVTEVVEAAEGDRNHDESNMFEEIGDIVIRVLDLCNNLNWNNLEEEIVKKLDKNMKRGHKHGGKEY